MSLDSSKRVSLGAALQCDRLKSLWPHQQARAVRWEKAISEEVSGCMPERLPWQLQSFSQIPQPPKQERQEASDFYQWCVKQPEKRDEKSASVPKLWPKAGMFRPSKEAWKRIAHSFHIPICCLEAGEEWTHLPLTPSPRSEL